HFGSKENLLLALMEEHLAGQAVEQIGLFDRERITWERPLAGSDHWMERLQEDPDPFRLFIELWSHAQRDERLRRRLSEGRDALRPPVARFAAASAADAGLQTQPQVAKLFADVMLGLGMGLGMLQLTDLDAVPPGLLGTTLSVLIRAAESSVQVRDA